jgi:hypothetical protein
MAKKIIPRRKPAMRAYKSMAQKIEACGVKKREIIEINEENNDTMKAKISMAS